MEDEKVIPTVQELASFDLNDPTIIELIHQAQESDAADRALTIMQALKKYKKAVFWAMFLSTSLIMEGYDLVIVSTFFPSSLEVVRNIRPDIPNTDQFLLWPDAISESIWSVQRISRAQYYHCSMAVRPVELCPCRPARGTSDQCIHSRPIWLSTDNDGLHGMASDHDFHSVLCAVSECLSIR